MDAAIQEKLAETLHYFASQAGEIQGSWEAQSDDYRKIALEHSRRIDKALHTLNQTVVRIDAPIVPASFEQTMLPHMIAFMQKFIVEKVKHPKGVAELFPTEELARQLILEFGYKPKAEVTVVQQDTKTEGTPAPTVEVKTKRQPTAKQLAFYNRGKKKEPVNA